MRSTIFFKATDKVGGRLLDGGVMLKLQSHSNVDINLNQNALIRALDDYASSRIFYVEDILNTKVPAKDSPLQDAISFLRRNSGKRIRPLLTLLPCEILGGNFKDALEAACAVEMVHESSLIFDDLPCMDNASHRRGQDTLHRKYGADIAILIGIYLLSEAYRSIACCNCYTPRLVEILADGIGDKGMVAGQTLDLRGLGSTSEAIEKKTGSLIKAAVQLGAVIGKASASQEYALVRYAERIGRAFQLRDDILDGDVDPSMQQEAIALANDAANDIFTIFGLQEASIALAGLAFYAVQWEG